MTYAGKRVIGTRATGAGFLGRQIAAAGASVVRNVGDGRAPFSGAVLPVGPVRLYLNEPDAQGEISGLRVKLDVAGTVAFLYMGTRPGARLDVGASLSAGAPVFHGIEPDGSPIHIARQGAGVIGLMAQLDDYQSRRAITHELMHVAQYDFSFISWSEPIERALLRHTPRGERIHRHVDLGFNVPVWQLLNYVIPHQERPWEWEASLLTDRPWP